MPLICAVSFACRGLLLEQEGKRKSTSKQICRRFFVDIGVGFVEMFK